MIYIITRTSISSAYPIFAQQGYENPREVTGRIVCANCHLANKPVDIDVPQVKYSAITFPILSLDLATEKDVHFLKYPICVGGNKGMGQIYSDGNKSSNTVYNAIVAEGESIKFDQPLTSNPNVGGFGQGDAEIVLQYPLHV
ncbi:hypothetical protein ACSBR2_010470 [Camellia fascicularis]